MGAFLIQFYVVGIVCVSPVTMSALRIADHQSCMAFLHSLSLPDRDRQLTGFGVFQEYYTTEWLPSYSASDVSWIGGVQYLFELGLGPVAGRL